MKVKPVEIKIGSYEDFVKTVKEGMKGPKPKTSRHIIFVRDSRAVSSILSPKRLELMRAIKDHPEYSISQLASALRRKREAVSRDISFLRAHGIVETERGKKVRAEVKPTHVVIEI
ncbi:MAG: ArsR family transcriptional regulator [Candidatus Zixiibacteriota bacterium]